jgi:hypothetical protein
MTLAASESPPRALRHIAGTDGARADTLRTLASAGFVVLFPGFLTYHYGVSAGWWGALLGGLFGGAAALFALASAASVIDRSAAREPMTAIHLLAAGTLAYMLVWSLLWWPSIRHDALVAPVMSEALATAVIWTAMLFVGSRFPLEDRAIRRISVIGIALTIVCFGHAFYSAGFPAGPFLAFVQAEEGGHATYQGIGRSLLAAGLVAALARRPGSAASVLVLGGAGVLMLTLGSRAHLFVLLLSLIMHVVVLTARRATRRLGLLSLLATLTVASVSIGFFLETRAAEVLDLASSASWEERGQANERALEIIAGNPIAGLFGYHAWDSSGYAHNALSAWTQYGLIGFAAYAITMLASTFTALAGFVRTRGRMPAWHLALHLNVVSVVLAIASEPIMASVFPALAWGFTIRAQRATRLGARPHGSR